MGGSKMQTVGYWYHPCFHLVMHHGPFDAFLRFRGGDVDAWEGTLTASGTIQITAAELWGGEDGEGGIAGEVDVMFGDADQMPNASIDDLIGPDGSAHRGHATLLFKGGRYGAMNPYPKAMSVLTCRILKGWDNDTPWYPDTAPIPVVGADGTPPTWIGGEFGTFFVGPRVDVTSPVEGFNEFTQALADQYGLAYDPVTAASEKLYFWRPNESGLLYSKREEGTEGNAATVNVLIGRGWQPNETALIRFWSITGLHMCVYTLGSASAPPPAPEGYSWFEGLDSPMATSLGPVRLWQSTDFLRRSGGFFAMNPAHIIYDTLTASNMQGEPAALVNEDSFQAAADRLYAESFGLCIFYDADQESIEEFRARICNTIGATCTRSTVNGQWYLDLIRGDCDVGTLPVLTDDDILDFQMEPTVLDDAVNQVCVKWFDPETKQERTTAPVQALGAIEATGRINAQTLEYLSIPSEGLAVRVAQRELQNRITPLKRFTLRTNRAPYSWRLGTYFRLQAPKRGIADMVCMVGDVGKGTLRSGAVSLVALQDVFSFPTASYVTGQAPVPPPSTTPVPVAYQVAFEAPYVELAGTLAGAELAALDGDAGFLMAAGVRPSAGNNYQLNTALSGGTFESVGTYDWCASATVNEAAGHLNTNFTYGDGTDVTRIRVGTAALWGSEMCRLDALDSVAGTLSLGRGCGDTVPVTHDAGERIFFYDEWSATDETEYLTGETVEAKLLTRTGTAMLALEAAPTAAVTFDQRVARPYPPGNMLVNGEPYPIDVVGDVVLTWSHRDRLLQADQLIDTTAADVGPEDGVTYTVEFFTESGTTPLTSETGITGTASTPWTPPSEGRYRVELYSVRSGLTSWQRHVHVVEHGEAALSIDDEVSAGHVVIAHRGSSFINPETTDVAYDASVLGGQYNLEADLWVNSSGSLVISHDASAAYVTTSSSNFSSLNDAAVAALVVDSGTWFGVPVAGAKVPLFRDVASAHVGGALFWTEVKDGVSGPAIVAELIAASIPLDQACVSSFTVGDLASATAAGYRTKLLGTTSSVITAAQSNNVDFVAYRKDASSTLFSAAAAAGVPAFAYTINRRFERDAILAAGAVGMYSDDAGYVSGDSPVATTDAFAAQTWMPGMVAANAANESRPTLAERGRFFASDYWGFSETADTKSFVLQGWACPIKDDVNADNYTIDLKITFDANSTGGTSRWAAMFIADGSELDKEYDDGTHLALGYLVLFRKNGTLEIFRRDSGSAPQIAVQAGSAISTATEVRFQVIMSPTAITVQRLDGGGSVVQSASASDTTYRGGYFHLGKFGLACKFRDLTIT